jgi:hypothetical protein
MGLAMRLGLASGPCFCVALWWWQHFFWAVGGRFGGGLAGVTHNITRVTQHCPCLPLQLTGCRAALGLEPVSDAAAAPALQSAAAAAAAAPPPPAAAAVTAAATETALPLPCAVPSAAAGGAGGEATLSWHVPRTAHARLGRLLQALEDDGTALGVTDTHCGLASLEEVFLSTVKQVRGDVYTSVILVGGCVVAVHAFGPIGWLRFTNLGFSIALA